MLPETSLSAWIPALHGWNDVTGACLLQMSETASTIFFEGVTKTGSAGELKIRLKLRTQLGQFEKV
jgi:hypothetical protein